MVKCMKKNVFVTLFGGMSLLFTSIDASAQNGGIESDPNNKKEESTGVEKNGNEAIAQSFTFTDCGLDYVFKANKVTDRISYPTGTGLPSGVTISGIPAGAVVVKSLLYWAITVDVSGSPNYSINGQSGVADLIGTGTEKCWYTSTLYNDPNYVATDLVTQNYRADVTSMVTGNGMYSVDLDDWSRLVDGLGIIVVYKQPGTAWEGTLVINDGCNTQDQGNNMNEFLPTVTLCADACKVKTFSMVSDFATASGDQYHYYTFNGGSQISKNDLFFQIDEVVDPFPLAAGTHTIPYNIKSDSYFAGTDCFNLAANGLYFRTFSCTACADNFQPDLVTVDASCGECDGSAVITPTGGTAPYSVQWSPNLPSGSNVFSASNLCEGDYSLILEDNSGCIIYEDSFSIAGAPAFQLDTVIFNPTSCTVCDGSIDVTISNAISDLTYTLTATGGAPIVQINNGHFGSLCAGIYNLSVVDANGCDYTDVIVINQTSDIVIDSVQITTDNGCAGNCNGSIAVFPDSGLNYSIDGGTNWQNTSLFTQICSDDYTIIIQDPFGCTNSETITVGASLLQISTGNDTTICENGSATLSIIATGGETPYTYNWSPTGTNDNSIVVNPTSTQLYTVSVTDNLGCQSTVSNFNVTLLPSINISNLMDLNYCEGASTMISSNVTGGNGNYNYTWIDVTSQQILGTNATLNFSHAGTGTVLLIVNDNCTSSPDTVSFNYTEEGKPALAISASDSYGCPPFSTTLSLNNLPNGTNVSWNIEGQTFNATNATLDYSTSTVGCQDANLNITTTSGCSFSYLFNQVFCVDPLPTALFQYSPVEPTTLNTSLDLLNASDPSYTSLWTISSNAHISDPTAYSPTVNYEFTQQEDIDVCLLVTDTLGCTDDICATITIASEFMLYVPNCFTPDNDDFNEVFIPITNVDPNETYHLSIFNRWGGLVFETNDPTKGWNGTYLNERVQDGTYIWKILMTKNSNTDGNQLYVGHVNVLK